MDTPVAIVTGAGSGIGRETCLLLAEEGYALSLVGRREQKLEEVRAHEADLSVRTEEFDRRQRELIGREQQLQEQARQHERKEKDLLRLAGQIATRDADLRRIEVEIDRWRTER